MKPIQTERARAACCSPSAYDNEDRGDNMPSSSSISALGPVNPSYQDEQGGEDQKSAPWIVRKLVGSMTGRIVVSSYESLRATGTSIVCLSPWGDSSPLMLPCIRFRDIAVHTVIAATGGMAAVAAPAMGPVADTVVGSFGDSIVTEIGLNAGFKLATEGLDELVISHPIDHIMAAQLHSKTLETTHVKTMLIIIKYKHTVEDAALGFYRSSIHQDSSLFASVKDYLAVEKGWFSPYLFASGRRPVIPRTMKPDVIFCHGPFLTGDYAIAKTLLAESASVITLCDAPPSEESPAPPPAHHNILSPSYLKSKLSRPERSRTPSPEPTFAAIPPPPQPRRLVLTVIGLKPHRKLWTTSQRPSESVINYQLLNGCPALVMPAKIGCPLVAWDTLTLEELWKVELPEEGQPSAGSKFEGIVNVLFEYLDMCVDWERVKLGLQANGGAKESSMQDKTVQTEDVDEYGKKKALRNALELVVAGAVRSGTSKEVKKEVDKERSGIAIWRMM